MKYMGSKNRIAKEILPIILKDRTPEQHYVEPFCGGCNLIDKVDGRRIANDNNIYLIELWRALVGGWIPKKYYDRAVYNLLRKEKLGNYPLVGWLGICCSYSGKWFGGFAGKVKTKGGIRNYQLEAYNNVMKQVPNLIGVKFCSGSYDSLNVPKNSIIYCDPPYEHTTKYKDDFDHVKFWEWVRQKSKLGHKVFVSEYSAPKDFKCVYSKDVKSSLSANGKSGSSKNSVEKLFIHKAQGIS